MTEDNTEPETEPETDSDEAPPEYAWSVDVSDLCAAELSVRVETVDGTYREGVLTDVLCDAMPFLGDEVMVPTAVELNHDPDMRILLAHIKSLQQHP